MSEKKTPLQQLLLDCQGLVRKVKLRIIKNGLRKVVILLDRQLLNQYQYSSQTSSMITYQITRRLRKTLYYLLEEYIKNKLWAKAVVEQLLERFNVYLVVSYLSLIKMLTPGEDLSLVNTQSDITPVSRQLSYSRIRQKLYDQLHNRVQLIKVQNLNTLESKVKVKFFLNDFMVSIFDQLLTYIHLFKATNEMTQCAKILHIYDCLMDQLKTTKHIGVLKQFFTYHQTVGQLKFQFCEFAQSIESYNKAIMYLQQIIQYTLDQEKCPNIIEEKDIKSVVPDFMNLIFILYIQSFNYEYIGQYSKMREAIHLAYWILKDVLRVGENNQMMLLIIPRQLDISGKFGQYFLEDSEICHYIGFLLGKDDLMEDNKEIDDFATEIDKKFYAKYQMEKLNKQQVFKLPQQTEKDKKQSIKYQNLYSPKISKTDRENWSKVYTSFTTQDQGPSYLEVESSHKNHNQEPEIQKHQIFIPRFQKPNRVLYTDYSSYCPTDTTDYPKLDKQLGNIIIKNLSGVQYLDFNQIKKNQQNKQSIAKSENLDIDLGKQIIKFKKHAQFINEPPEEKTKGELTQEIRIQYELFSQCLDGETTVRKKKLAVQKQQLELEAENVKKGNKLRQIMIRHSTALGLKKLKKKLIKKEEEQVHKHHDIVLIPETRAETQDAKSAIRKTMATNLNVIKLLMDENISEQASAVKQLRQRHHSNPQSALTKDRQSAQKSTYLKQVFTKLAESTQYISAKGDMSKKIHSIADLANIRRKLNVLETKKTVNYSELFKEQITN